MAKNKYVKNKKNLKMYVRITYDNFYILQAQCLAHMAFSDRHPNGKLDSFDQVIDEISGWI